MQLSSASRLRPVSALFDVDRVQQALRSHGTEVAFETSLQIGIVMLASAFLYPAVANYLMAMRQVCRQARRRAMSRHPQRRPTPAVVTPVPTAGNAAPAMPVQPEPTDP